MRGAPRKNVPNEATLDQYFVPVTFWTFARKIVFLPLIAFWTGAVLRRVDRLESAADQPGIRKRGEDEYEIDGDTLWGLAERHLGSGEAWREIAALNRGRKMADGAPADAPVGGRPVPFSVPPAFSTASGQPRTGPIVHCLPAPIPS